MSLGTLFYSHDFAYISNDEKYFHWNEKLTDLEYWEHISFLKVSVSYFIFVPFYVGNNLEGSCYVKLLGSKNMVYLSQQSFTWFQSLGRPCIFSTTNMQMLNISMVKHQSFAKTIVSLVAATELQCGKHHLILKGSLKKIIFSSRYKKKISYSYDCYEELETDLKYFQR